jgi:hypothetical protein
MMALVGNAVDGEKLKNAAALGKVRAMSALEILKELPKLTPVELQHIHERILELEEALEVEETPELLAAVDAGLRSLETERTYTADEARARIVQWTSKSS